MGFTVLDNGNEESALNKHEYNPSLNVLDAEQDGIRGAVGNIQSELQELPSDDDY